jgi:hypothetical protein
MNATADDKIIYRGSSSWWGIVGSVPIDWDDKPQIALTDFNDSESWNRAAAVAGLDTDDEECWVQIVTHVDDRHSAIWVGDFACCQGIGCDVVFVRLRERKDTSIDDACEELAGRIARTGTINRV